MKKLLIIAPLLLALSGCSDEPVKASQVQELFDVIVDKTEICMTDVAKAKGTSNSEVRQGISVLKAMFAAQVPNVYKQLTDNKVSATDFDACLDATKTSMSEISCEAMMKSQVKPLKECHFLPSLGNPTK